MATQNSTPSPKILEQQWEQYWVKWDEEIATNQTSWSPSVRRAYDCYRQTVENARTENVQMIMRLEDILKARVTKDGKSEDEQKVRRFFHDIELARIEASHSERNGADLRQETADAKRRYTGSHLQRKKDQYTRELYQASEKEIMNARESINNDFVIVHTEAWFDLVAADEKNVNGDRDKWPKYPPALLEQFSDTAELDASNGYGSTR